MLVTTVKLTQRQLLTRGICQESGNGVWLEGNLSERQGFLASNLLKKRLLRVLARHY